MPPEATQSKNLIQPSVQYTCIVQSSRMGNLFSILIGCHNPPKAVVCNVFFLSFRKCRFQVLRFGYTGRSELLSLDLKSDSNPTNGYFGNIFFPTVHNSYSVGTLFVFQNI